MKKRRQEQTEETLVGMDLHSEKVQLCITKWTHGSDPVPVRTVVTTVQSLEGTYHRLMPVGALTVLEASTNSFHVARRLVSLGYPTKVLRPDVASGLSDNDRVNDRIDAYNIALAYARTGDTFKVYVPSPLYHEYRDLWFAYRNATKDSTRGRNRIWGFCSQHGLTELAKAKTRRPDRIRKHIRALGWSQEQAFQLETMLLALEFAESMRARCLRRIEQIASETPSMRRAMTVLGIGALNAFALMAFVENVERFDSPKKLVRYVGLNPRVCESGDFEGRHGLSHRGRGDLRCLLVESANSALRHGKEPMHKWARRKIASGKPRNLILCALARKMVMVLWHALKGHPVPCREPEPCFRRKLEILARHIGTEQLKAMGYDKASDFVKDIADPLYEHLPQRRAEQEEKAAKTA